MTAAAASDADGHVERESSRSRTLELEIDIPIYDFGQSKVALAEQTYMQAANRLAEKAVNARSEAREAYTAYRANYDITRQYQNNVLPLRKIIQEQSLLQYSGMLNDVTDLITDARNRILSNVAAINARRDFWIAHTDFKHALIGGGSGGGGSATVAACRRRRCRRRRTLSGRKEQNNDHAIAQRLHRHLRPRRRSGRRRLRTYGLRRRARGPDHDGGDDAGAAGADDGAGLPAGRDAERLDLALAHERRLEGVPSRRRAGGARVRARHEGLSLGL
jgi:hypothetical protein